MVVVVKRQYRSNEKGASASSCMLALTNPPVLRFLPVEQLQNLDVNHLATAGVPVRAVQLAAVRQRAVPVAQNGGVNNRNNNNNQQQRNRGVWHRVRNDWRVMMLLALIQIVEMLSLLAGAAVVGLWSAYDIMRNRAARAPTTLAFEVAVCIVSVNFLSVVFSGGNAGFLFSHRQRGQRQQQGPRGMWQRLISLLACVYDIGVVACEVWVPIWLLYDIMCGSCGVAILACEVVVTLALICRIGVYLERLGNGPL